MVIRWDTTCPRCKKENSVFEHEMFCKDCKLRSFIKARVKSNLWNRRMTADVNKMKPNILEKLHKEIMEEILEEERFGEEERKKNLYKQDEENDKKNI
ncbi:hypothetical protein LCGC14_1011940 [marine sediment metagenome]|uniref:Uncharacterized protein n=1 Tax=marine sediment metagenome TaxID=412755 RepID=A0A0F9R650_9ZZZZ